jgi:hypothetical protein
MSEDLTVAALKNGLTAPRRQGFNCVAEYACQAHDLA